jgi:hypothetical protein
MPLADGDRPANGDVWFRVLTSNSHIVKGRVNHAAFKGNFMRPPKAANNRPWNAEASGRLRSLAGSIDDVNAHAEDYCTKLNTKFFGLMFPKKPLSGAVVQNLTLDFCYTPILNGDTAHADLTFTGPVPAEKSPEHDQLMHALVDRFTAIYTGQIELLPPATIQPPSLLERIQVALQSVSRKMFGR